MSVLRFLPLFLLGLSVLGGVAIAAEVSPRYNYITAQALQERLAAGQPTNLVDIQVEEEFTRHHIKGAVATHAYPVKSEADTAKLAAAVEKIQGNSDPVVIICPRGAGGATRTYDYLLTRGIAAERLLILEKGQEGWSCAELTEGK